MHWRFYFCRECFNIGVFLHCVLSPVLFFWLQNKILIKYISFSISSHSFWEETKVEDMLRILVHDMAILLGCLLMYVFRRFQNTKRCLLVHVCIYHNYGGSYEGAGSSCTHEAQGRKERSRLDWLVVNSLATIWTKRHTNTHKLCITYHNKLR